VTKARPAPNPAQTGTRLVPIVTPADSLPSETATSGTEVSKEPIEQLHNGFPKRLGGFPVSHEGHDGNEAHEDNAQFYDAEERINSVFGHFLPNETVPMEQCKVSIHHQRAIARMFFEQEFIGGRRPISRRLG
jgi:hypothetical protein